MARKEWKRALRFGAVATVSSVALVLAACTGGSGATDDDGDGAVTADHVGVVTPAPFVSWDPVAAFTPYGGGLYYQAVYDTLIHETAEGEFEPNLATEWTYDDALTTLTVDLRTDVTFTDGSAFDADAAVTNLERARTTPGPNITALANVSSVTAVDEDTIELKLSLPDPGLVQNLARTVGQMVSPAYLEAGDFTQAPVGSGPYVLDETDTVDGEQYSYTRNDEYWNTEAWPFDSITVYWMDDPTARLNAVKAGQVNATQIEFTQVAEANSAGLTASSFGGGAVGIMFLDLDGTTDPALGDVRVRQAISYALDSEALSEAFSAGEGRVTDQVFDPEGEAYIEALDDAYSRDVDKAKELLAEAGYPDGITLSLPDSSGAFPGVPIMAALQEQLAEAGITLEITDSTLAFPDIVNQVFAGAYGAWVTQFAIGSDWYNISQWVLPTSTFNPFKVNDPELAALLDNVRSTTGDEQTAAFQDVNKFIVDNAYGAWTYVAPYAYATDDTVTAANHLGEQSAWLADLTPAG